MKIEKAIEILTHLSLGYNLSSPQEHNDAVKLGIEALKELEVLRDTALFGNWKLLPGETVGVENDH